MSAERTQDLLQPTAAKVAARKRTADEYDLDPELNAGERRMAASIRQRRGDPFALIGWLHGVPLMERPAARLLLLRELGTERGARVLSQAFGAGSVRDHVSQRAATATARPTAERAMPASAAGVAAVGASMDLDTGRATTVAAAVVRLLADRDPQAPSDALALLESIEGALRPLVGAQLRAHRMPASLGSPTAEEVLARRTNGHSAEILAGRPLASGVRFPQRGPIGRREGSVSRWLDRSAERARPQVGGRLEAAVDSGGRRLGKLAERIVGNTLGRRAALELRAFADAAVEGFAAPRTVARDRNVTGRGLHQEDERVLGRGEGARLPLELERRLGKLLGHDFSHVRIHIDEGAAGTAERLGANALTVASHIFFGRGAFAPGSTAGDRLLVHELTHVVQHDHGRLAHGGSGLRVTSPTDTVEQEARAAEHKAARLAPVAPAAVLPVAGVAPTSAPKPATPKAAPRIAEPTLGTAVAGSWRSALGSVWDHTGGAAIRAGEWVGKKVVQAGEVVGEAIAEGAEAVFERVAPAWLVQFVHDPAGYITRKFNQLIQSGMQALTQRFSGVINLGKSLLELASAFETAFEVLGSVGEKQKACCEEFTHALGVIRHFGEKLLHNPAVDAVRAGLKQLDAGISWLVRVFGGAIFDFFKAAIPAVWHAVVELKDGIMSVVGALGAAKDWLLDKLAIIGLDLRGGEGGLLAWIGKQLAPVWERIKAAFNLETLKQVGATLIAVSPLGPIVYIFTHFSEIKSFISEVVEIWQHRNDPAFLKNAGATGGLRGRLMKLFAGGSGLLAQLGAKLSQAATWVATTFGKVMNAVGSAIAWLEQSAFGHWLGDILTKVKAWVDGLLEWGQKAITPAVEKVKSVAHSAWQFVEPYVGLLQNIAAAILFPPAIIGIVAGAFWHRLEPCIKEPIVDLLLDGMIGFITVVPELAMFGPLWQLMRRGFVGFLKRLRHNPKRVALFDGVAKMFTAPAVAAYHFVVGFLSGVVDNLIFPFEAIWGAIKVIGWVGGLLQKLAVQASAPRPTGKKVEVANERSTTVEQARTQGNEAPALEPTQAPSAEGAVADHAGGGAGDTGFLAGLGDKLLEIGRNLKASFDALIDATKGGLVSAVREAFKSQGPSMSFESIASGFSALWGKVLGKVESLSGDIADKLVDGFSSGGIASAVSTVCHWIGYIVGTIVFQVVIDALTAGAYTFIGPTVIAIAKFINWPAHLLGPLFKLMGMFGRLVPTFVKEAGASLGAGAFKFLEKVMGPLDSFGKSIVSGADELAGMWATAGAKEGGTIVQKGAREAGIYTGLVRRNPKLAEMEGESMLARKADQAGLDLGQQTAANTVKKEGATVVEKDAASTVEKDGLHTPSPREPVAVKETPKPKETPKTKVANGDHPQRIENSTASGTRTRMPAAEHDPKALRTAQNVPVGHPIASEATAHDILRKLAAGDKNALAAVGVGRLEMDANAVEWGIGMLPDRRFIIVRGEPSAVAWTNFPGIRVVAHSHPVLPENVLKLGSDSIDAIFKDGGEDMIKLFPSGADVSFMSRQNLAVGSEVAHTVHTPYRYLGGGKIGNADQVGPTLDFIISRARPSGKVGILTEHAAEVTAMADGKEVWRGTVYAHDVQGYGSSLSSKPLGEIMPNVQALEKGGAHEVEMGASHPAGQAFNPEIGERNTAASLEGNATKSGGTGSYDPRPGDVVSYQSQSGNFYRGKFGGYDAQGNVLLDMGEGMKPLNRARLGPPRSGVSVDALHGLGEHDTVTLYSVRGNARTGHVVGYTPEGYIRFKPIEGEEQLLRADQLDLARTQRVTVPDGPVVAPVAAQTARAPRTWDGYTPQPGEMVSFQSKSGSYYRGKFLGYDGEGKVLLERGNGAELLDPDRLVTARPGISVDALHGYGPNDTITLYSVRGNPRTGSIVGFTDRNSIMFRKTTGAVEELSVAQLDLARTEASTARAADNAAVPAGSPALLGGKSVGGVVHFGQDAAGHLALVEKLGLTPSRAVEVGGATFKLGPLFEIGDGRVAALMEVEVGGQRYLRAVYRSNSQGGFRLLPARNMRLGQMGLPGFDKAIGEHAIMLPNEVEELLSQQLVGGQVRRDVSETAANEIFEGAVPVNRSVDDYLKYSSGPDYIDKHVVEQKLLDAPKETLATSGGHSLPAPSSVRISVPGQRPDFSRLIRSSRSSTAVAGEVDAMVYRSVDGSLEYVVYKDSSERIWFKSVSKLDAKVTAQGVREVAIDADALCTPLWEYGQQIPTGFVGIQNAAQKSYYDAWAYVREMEEVKSWYAATGTMMPGERFASERVSSLGAMNSTESGLASNQIAVDAKQAVIEGRHPEVPARASTAAKTRELVGDFKGNSGMGTCKATTDTLQKEIFEKTGQRVDLIEGTRHYFARTSDGVLIDPTIMQFFKVPEGYAEVFVGSESELAVFLEAKRVEFGFRPPFDHVPSGQTLYEGTWKGGHVFQDGRGLVRIEPEDAGDEVIVLFDRELAKSAKATPSLPEGAKPWTKSEDGRQVFRVEGEEKFIDERGHLTDDEGLLVNPKNPKTGDYWNYVNDKGEAVDSTGKLLSERAEVKPAVSTGGQMVENPAEIKAAFDRLFGERIARGEKIYAYRGLRLPKDTVLRGTDAGYHGLGQMAVMPVAGDEEALRGALAYAIQAPGLGTKAADDVVALVRFEVKPEMIAFDAYGQMDHVFISKDIDILVGNSRVLQRPVAELETAASQDAFREELVAGRTEAIQAKTKIASPQMQARYAEPADLAATVERVRGDLRGVVAREADGKVTSFYDKLMADTTLASDQKERVIRAMARTTEHYAEVGKAGSAAYQEINRLHTLSEIDRVLDACRTMKLSPTETEDALLASIFSDSHKMPGLQSLVTHNQDGADAAAVYLSRELGNSPEAVERIARIRAYVKEHQIGPPVFFSNMVATTIKVQRGAVALTEDEVAALASLKAKIADPLNPAHLDATGGAIAFTPAEQKLLDGIGVHEWPVPRDRASFAVIAGDSAINYASPEGAAKIVSIRGPATPFKDVDAQASVASVLGSAGSSVDARAVLPRDLWPLYDRQVAATELAVDRAELRIDDWLRGQGHDPAATPFWRGTPLAYTEGNASAEEQLAIELRAQFDAYLREEQGRYLELGASRPAAASVEAVSAPTVAKVADPVLVPTGGAAIKARLESDGVVVLSPKAESGDIFFVKAMERARTSASGTDELDALLEGRLSHDDLVHDKKLGYRNGVTVHSPHGGSTTLSGSGVRYVAIGRVNPRELAYASRQLAWADVHDVTAVITDGIALDRVHAIVDLQSKIGDHVYEGMQVDSRLESFRLSAQAQPGVPLEQISGVNEARVARVQSPEAIEGYRQWRQIVTGRPMSVDEAAAEIQHRMKSATTPSTAPDAWMDDVVPRGGAERARLDSPDMKPVQRDSFVGAMSEQLRHPGALGADGKGVLPKVAPSGEPLPAVVRAQEIMGTPRTFGGVPAHFQLQTLEDGSLRINIRAHFDASKGMPPGIVRMMQKRTEQAVGRWWDGTFTLVDRGGVRRPLRVGIEWVDADAADTVVHLKPFTFRENSETYAASTSQKTIAHELGHTIGMPDEYLDPLTKNAYAVSGRLRQSSPHVITDGGLMSAGVEVKARYGTYLADLLNQATGEAYESRLTRDLARELEGSSARQAERVTTAAATGLLPAAERATYEPSTFYNFEMSGSVDVGNLGYPKSRRGYADARDHLWTQIKHDLPTTHVTEQPGFEGEKRYVGRITVRGPDGRAFEMETIWLIPNEGAAPELIAHKLSYSEEAPVLASGPAASAAGVETAANEPEVALAPEVEVAPAAHRGGARHATEPRPKSRLSPVQRARLRMPLSKRHRVESITQGSVKKAINTVIDETVDVAADMEIIRAGEAIEGYSNNYTTFTVGERTYGVHDDATFPLSGPGFTTLNRAGFEALGIFNKLGDTDEARAILDKMHMSAADIEAGAAVYARRPSAILTSHAARLTLNTLAEDAVLAATPDDARPERAAAKVLIRRARARKGALPSSVGGTAAKKKLDDPHDE